ncbi:hypothetical protein JX266_011532 [Neoarthrinium moseri]|nr:hypothetical protein JX266_011532 [Neoarthrinium moseri]
MEHDAIDLSLFEDSTEQKSWVPEMPHYDPSSGLYGNFNQGDFTRVRNTAYELAGKVQRLETIRLLKPITTTTATGATCEDESTVRYCLQEFTCNESPAYVALSYVWGPANLSIDECIIVNDVKRTIHRNLSLALRDVASSISGGNSEEACDYIWVDAICIDQSNNAEKEQVVPHMGQIFSSAARVYAWLGPFSDYGASRCEKMLSFLETLGVLFWQLARDISQQRDGNAPPLHDIMASCLPSLTKMFDSCVDDQINLINYFMRDYYQFSKLEYWRRMWVLQEVHLAKDLRFVCNLERRFPLRLITGGVLLLETFQQHVVACESSAQSLTASRPALRRFAVTNPACPEMHQMLLYTTMYDPAVMSLRLAMTNFCVKDRPWGCVASNAPDMIFGLLGFATSQEREYITPDYVSLTDTVFKDVTRTLILRGGFTDILSWAQLGREMIWMPTWVPDYSSTIRESLCSQHQAKSWLPKFNAGGALDFEFPPQKSDEDVLTLSGTIIDTISSVGSIWRPGVVDPKKIHDLPQAGNTIFSNNTAQTTTTRFASYTDILSFLQEANMFCSKAEALRSRKDSSAKAEPLGTLTITQAPTHPPPTRDASWRVPCADQLVVNGRLVRSDPVTPHLHALTLQTLEASKLSLTADDSGTSHVPFPIECRPYVESLLRWVDKRIFITQKGFVGLGPVGIAPGCGVAVFDGFAAPYILRKDGWRWPQNIPSSQKDIGANSTDEKSAAEPRVPYEVFQLAGEAYVDGFMDCEVETIGMGKQLIRLV